MFLLFLSIQVTQLSTSNNSNLQSNINTASLNEQKLLPRISFSLSSEGRQLAAKNFGNSQNYDGNNLQAFHLHKHADLKKMLDFNPKHSENNATFLKGRHF